MIDEVRARLAPEARALLDAQLKEVNLVQRHARREVNCYRMRGGEARSDPATLFPNRADDLRFASVTLRAPGEPATLSADLHLTRGRFFSIVFDADPARFKDRADDLAVAAVRVLQDPMREVPAEGGRATDASRQLTGWLRELAERYGFTEVGPPLPPEERARFLREIPAALPGDYLEAASQCDGFVVRLCAVKGPSQVYDVVTDEKDYYVLAEVEGRGVLAVAAGDGPRIYFLDFDGGEPAPQGTSLRAALEAFLGPA